MKTPVRTLSVLLCACACAAPRPPPPKPPEAPPPAAALPAPPPAVAEPAPVDRSRPPPLGPSEPLSLPRQLHFILSNGLRVRLVEQHRLPLVALELVVDAGSSRDPANLPGLASFTAAMVTEGTRTRSATQISDQVGFLGAALSAAAGPDSASLSGSCLSRQLKDFMAIFSDVAMHPAFAEGDVERVRDERRVTLIQQRDQPAIVAVKAFASLFWGDHPYGHPIIGTENGLSRTRRSDLAEFHDRYWRPGDAQLVVVGDVTEDQLRRILAGTLGFWEEGGHPAPPLPARPPAAPHRTLVIDKRNASQSYLALGAPGLDRRSPDFVAATVMFEVLGGGTSSRLFRGLREEKGYTYGIGAGADARRLGGASVVRGSVKAEVTGAALKDLLAELSRMREEPVPADELEEAKAGIVRALPAEFATVGEIAGQLAELALYDLPDDYWNTYAEEVHDVSAADVKEMAERYLDPGHLTLVMVGPREVVGPQLVSLPLGEVETGGVSRPTPPRPAPPPRANGLLPRKPTPNTPAATGGTEAP